MIRIVADTNIYISAILFDGKPEIVIKLAAAEKVALFTAHSIMAEVATVLRNRFQWTNQQVAYADQFIRDLSVLVTPSCRIGKIREDDTDNRVLECALEAKADFIVTGDRTHLLALKSYRGMQIVGASAFLKIIENKKNIC